MKLEQFKNIVTMLVTELEKRDRYAEQLPPDLSAAVLDNEYVNSLGWTHDRLIEHALGAELSEYVNTFMYETEKSENIHNDIAKFITWVVENSTEIEG